MQRDFLKVNIYYESKTIEKIQESPLMGAQSLLSNLGGAISFYLGISVIALFELLELFGRYLRVCFRGGAKKWVLAANRIFWTNYERWMGNSPPHFICCWCYFLSPIFFDLARYWYCVWVWSCLFFFGTANSYTVLSYSCLYVLVLLLSWDSVVVRVGQIPPVTENPIPGICGMGYGICGTSRTFPYKLEI